jgi:hypothetical protein
MAVAPRSAAPPTRPAAPPPPSPPTGPSAAGAGATSVLADRAARKSGTKGGQYALIGLSVVGLLAGAALIIGLMAMQNGDTDEGLADETGGSQPLTVVEELPDSVTPPPAPATSLTVEQQKKIVRSILK